MIRAADGTIIYCEPPLTWGQRLADAAHCVASVVALTGFLVAVFLWAVGVSS